MTKVKGVIDVELCKEERANANNIIRLKKNLKFKE